MKIKTLAYVQHYHLCALSVEKNHQCSRPSKLVVVEEEPSKASFSSIMGMPSPTSKNCWSMRKDFIYDTSLKMLKECIEAGKRLHSQVIEEDKSVIETSTLDVTVSFDGTWHHCGFKSSHGVGVAMSVDTGEILDVVVLSKTCTISEKHASDKSAEEFEAWQMQHQQSGQCE